MEYLFIYNIRICNTVTSLNITHTDTHTLKVLTDQIKYRVLVMECGVQQEFNRKALLIITK